MTKFLRRYVLSLDSALGIVAGISTFALLPTSVSYSFTKDVLGVGISVISIIFSIFFASLTFIISSSDDSFVQFLQDKGHYEDIIWDFRLTLWALFVSLVYSTVLYIITSFWDNYTCNLSHSKLWITVFSILFFYSIAASILTSKSAIRYSKARSMFMKDHDSS